MDLLKAFFFILDMWRPAFCKTAAFNRARALAIACLCSFGRKTITSMAIFLGRSNKIPIADYKFFSKNTWDVRDLFNPIFLEATKYCRGNYISVAADDTKLHKTGKKYPMPVGKPIRWDRLSR